MIDFSTDANSSSLNRVAYMSYLKWSKFDIASISIVKGLIVSLGTWSRVRPSSSFIVTLIGFGRWFDLIAFISSNIQGNLLSNSSPSPLAVELINNAFYSSSGVIFTSSSCSLSKVGDTFYYIYWGNCYCSFVVGKIGGLIPCAANFSKCSLTIYWSKAY